MSKKNHFYKGSWQDPGIANSPFVDMIEDEDYNKKESKRMRIEQIQHDLEETGKMCLQLSKEIMQGGRALSNREKQLVKMVQYNFLKVRLDEAAMFYFMDNKADFEQAMEAMLRFSADDSII